MRQLAIAIAAGAALGMAMPQVAAAADMPVKAPVLKAPAAVATSWTGLYLDAGFGYGFWTADTRTVDPTGVPRLGVRQRQGGRGWLGTVGVGYDAQITQKIVLGVLFDYDFSSLEGDIQDQDPYFVAQTKQDWAWAVGARAGWLVTPTLLTYINGGYTQAHFTGNEAFVTLTGHASGTHYQDITAHGWFIGGGTEWQLAGIGPFGPGWSWRNEYRLAEYDKQDFENCFDSGVCPATYRIEFKPYVQTVRSELVYKFNWAGLK